MLPNGAYVYRVPVALPQGTLGVQPSLSLVYSSQGGSGYLGTGWGLSGFGQIHRTSGASGIHFNSSDRLLSEDGLLVEVPGASKSFHSKRESWNRYEPLGTCGQGPCGWVKTGRSGSKSYYGQTANSRLEAQGQNGTIQKWSLDQVEDTHGNYYTIEYLKEGANGTLYPSKVTYTLGNGRSAASARTVEFVYQSKPDQRARLVQHGTELINQRLARIDVKSGNQLLRAYGLTYDQSPDTGRSRLIGVSQFGSDGSSNGASALVSQSFQYQTLLSSGAFAAAQNIDGAWGVPRSVWQADNYRLIPGDFDGNGKNDLLFQPKKTSLGAKLLLADQKGGFRSAVDITNNSGMNIGAWVFQNKLIHVADWNNDGFDDLVLQGTDTAQPTLYLQATGSGQFETVQNISGLAGMTQASWSAAQSSLSVADFNGDGKTDALFNGVLRHQPGAFLFRNLDGSFRRQPMTHADWGLPVVAVPDVTVAPVSNFLVRALDINGDAIPEILFQPADGSSVTYMAESSPGGYKKAVDITHRFGANSTLWNQSLFNLLTVDFNRDGNTDLLFQNRTNGHGVFVLYGNGTTFSPPQNIAGVGGLNENLWNANHSRVVPTDLEGNGTGGFLLLPKLASQPSYYLKASPQGGFEAKIPVNQITKVPQAVWSQEQSSLMTGDFNSDGVLDLLIQPKNGSFPAQLLTGITGKRDALVQINQGLGAKVQIGYQSVHQHNSAIVPSNNSGANQANVSSRYLAVSEKISNGRGLTQVKTYSYADGRALHGNLDQTKDLGFSTFTSHNVTLGTTEVQKYNQTFDLAMKLSQIERFRTNGKLSSSDTMTWAKVFPYAGVESVRLSQSTAKSYEGITLVRSSTITKTYDSYGNQTAASMCVNQQCTQVETSYNNDPTHWKLGQALQSAVYDGSTLLQASKYSYNGDQLVAQESYLCADAATCSFGAGQWIAQIQGIQYDSSGNMTSVKDANGNVSSLAFDSTWNTYVVSSTNALGHKSLMTTDAEGRVQVATDPNGNQTAYSYDLFGRQTEVRIAGGGIERSSYSTLGDPNTQYETRSKLVSAPGAVEQWLDQTTYFDGFGDVYLKVHTGDGGKQIRTEIKRSYQPGQVVVSQSLPAFTGDPLVWTRKFMDESGRVLKIKNPDGTSESFLFGPNRVAHTDKKGNKSTRDLNAQGRVKTLTDNAGNLTKYGFDVNGRLTTVTLADGYTVVQKYDSFGRVVQQSDPSLGTVSFSYDPMGNLTRKADNLSQGVSFSYDKLNRPVLKVNQEGEETQFEYDDPSFTNSVGRLSRIKDPIRTVERAYDTAGNLTHEAVRYNALAALFVKKWSYDLAGRVRTQTLPTFGPQAPTQTAYQYTEGGNLFEVLVDNEIYARYSGYNALGQVGQKSLDPGLPSEVTTSYNYDASAMLKTMATSNLRGTLQDMRYKYDNLGNILKIQDKVSFELEKEDDEDSRERDQSDEDSAGNALTVTAPTYKVETQQYQYDSLSRLVSASGSYGQKNFAYNAVGNMTQIGALVDRDLVYQGHRVVAGTGLEVKYDGVGNVTKKLEDGTLWEYKWDSEARMRQVYKNSTLKQSMEYDYTGERVLRVVYRGDEHQKLFSTFFPVSGMEVRMNGNKNEFKVTKMISAGRLGNLASFDETFKLTEVDEAGQYLAYLDMFDTNRPEGLLVSLAYRGMATLSDPVVSKNLPVTIFGFLTALLLLGLAWGRKNVQLEATSFRPFQRGMAFTMVLMMFWVASCSKVDEDETSSKKSKKSHSHDQGDRDKDSDRDDLTLVLERGKHNKLYYHANHVQTATMVTDDQGEVKSRMRHLPYGELDRGSSKGQDSVDKQYASFTGQVMDFDTGLIYYHARYYDPSIGRFLSPDSMIPGGGSDPQQVNRYAYVSNNPINYSDPTGHWGIKIHNPIAAVVNAVNSAKDAAVAAANSAKDAAIAAAESARVAAVAAAERVRVAAVAAAERVRVAAVAAAERVRLAVLAEAERVRLAVAAAAEAARQEAIAAAARAAAAAEAARVRAVAISRAQDVGRSLSMESIYRGISSVSSAATKDVNQMVGSVDDYYHEHQEVIVAVAQAAAATAACVYLPALCAKLAPVAVLYGGYEAGNAYMKNGSSEKSILGHGTAALCGAFVPGCTQYGQAYPDQFSGTIDALIGGPGDWKNADPTNGSRAQQYQEDAGKSWEDLTRFSF